MKYILTIAILFFSGNSISKEITPCDNPKGRSGQAACFKYQYEKEEIKLNETYKDLVEFSKSHFNVGSKTGENVANTLMASQQEWEEYRDTYCEYKYDTYYPGSGAYNRKIYCKLKITRARLKELTKEYDFWLSR